MKILVVNDDGIHSQGLQALVQALSEQHDVYVCAPESERSAASHAITLLTPLFLRRVELPGAREAYTVTGTPADCTRMGIYKMGKPDVVFSGINHGANTGVDILYSGTVSAAAEGMVQGVPSAAVSVLRTEAYDFGAACEYALKLADYLSNHQLPARTLLNLNCPSAGCGQAKGLKFAPMGWQKYEGEYELRQDPRGREYYWAPFDGDGTTDDLEGTDLYWLNRGYATLTPLRFDLTDQPLMKLLQTDFK